MELPLEASQFVLDGQADPSLSTYRLHKVAEGSRSGVQSLIDLVKNLRVYLTAVDGDTRARATLLLAKVWLHHAWRLQTPCGSLFLLMPLRVIPSLLMLRADRF